MPDSHFLPSLTADAGTEDIERILVVTAHPDDVDFGVAGSVAAWTDAAVDVAYCIATDGDAGGSDRSVSRADMAVLRREEQTEAAKVVGVTDVTFLGFPDGRLQPDLALRRAISGVIRRFRPDRVVAQSPERNWSRIYASHPDHLAAGEAAICAVYPDARNPFAFQSSRVALSPPAHVNIFILRISDRRVAGLVVKNCTHPASPQLRTM